jgi:Glycosyltransferase family 87
MPEHDSAGGSYRRVMKHPASRNAMSDWAARMAPALTDRARAQRLAIAVCLGLVLAGMVAGALALGWHPTQVGGDAWNYLAAGERLNAGHPLYVLAAGDRMVPINPPFWTVPLLAPPPIAVAWRILAPLGDAAMVIWDVAAIPAVLAVVAILGRRAASWPVIALLAAPLTMTALSGNASSFLLAAMVAAWAYRDRPWIVGALVAAMVAIKLTPVVLLVWLMASRRWRAVGVALAVGAVIGAVSVVGAGPDAWRAWLASVPASAPSRLAISTILNVPTWAVAVAAPTVVAGTWIATRSDRATFAAAVIGAALATPALYAQALALLLAAVAPWTLKSGSRWDGDRQEERLGRDLIEAPREGRLLARVRRRRVSAS